MLPIGAVYRLENPGKILLELIEVQTASYISAKMILSASRTIIKGLEGTVETSDIHAALRAGSCALGATSALSQSCGELDRLSLVLLQSLHFGRPGRCGFRSRTPGPPPFSAMNSTPAFLRADAIATRASSDTRMPSSASARLTVGIDRLAAVATSLCDHPRRARAARI
jgi:hypothetical protein